MVARLVVRREVGEVVLCDGQAMHGGEVETFAYVGDGVAGEHEIGGMIEDRSDLELLKRRIEDLHILRIADADPPAVVPAVLVH